MNPLDVHALRPRVYATTLSTAAESFLSLEDNLAPLIAARPLAIIVYAACVTTADELAEDLHPAFLVFGCVGVEVDDFAIVETDAEALFDEHVTFLFFGECRSTALASLAGCLLFC